MCFPQRESDVFNCSDSVRLSQTRKRRRRYVQKSSETLAGYAFVDLAVKAKQDEEDNVTSE